MKAYSITHFSPRVPISRDGFDDILRFDSDNSYPQRIAEYVRNSGTATACVNLLKKFIVGEGFEDASFYKAIVNYKYHTVDQLLRLCAEDYARFGGFALHINYNALFEIDAIQHVKFEHCRWGLPDDWGYIPHVAVFDNWDSKNLTKKNWDRLIDYIDVYNPNPEAIEGQILRDGGIHHYNGQILYYTGDCQEYPTAPFHAVLEDVQSDAEAKDFRLRNLQHGFMASHIIRVPKFQSEEERDDFHANVKKFQGSNQAGKILLLETEGFDSSSNEFDIETVELQDVDRHFEHSEQSAKDAIIGAFNQPIALHPMRVSGKLGNSQEIAESFLYYNEFTRDSRRIFEEAFQALFSRFSRKVNTTGNFQIVPLMYGGAQKENDKGKNETEGGQDGNIPDSSE